jgi:hypothetical protein
MAYGEPFATSCEAKVDYSGNIILDLLDDVFKTMIFPKMCKGMDNATLFPSPTLPSDQFPANMMGI